MLKTISTVRRKRLKSTGDELLPVFAQLSELWPKFIFSSSHGNLYLQWCYRRQLFLSFRKWKKDCTILKVILVQGFCPLKLIVSAFIK